MKRKFFAYPYIVWMILFIVAPMLFILYYAVNVGGEWTVTKAWATLSDAGKWNILWTSVVMARYDLGDGMQGMIGVVGPTRMDYAQVAARLSYFSEGLGKMFSKALPPSSQEENETPLQED